MGGQARRVCQEREPALVAPHIALDIMRCPRQLAPEIGKEHMADSKLPAEVSREIGEITQLMEPGFRKRVRDLAEQRLFELHHGYGTWLRNQFRRGQYPHLFRYCHTRIGSEPLSFDALSGVAIYEIWRQVRERP